MFYSVVFSSSIVWINCTEVQLELLQWITCGEYFQCVYWSRLKSIFCPQVTLTTSRGRVTMPRTTSSNFNHHY
uniref:Putative secreted protein n=1 Tax=Anopheles marajoara TaxID=58244 RepID=A0A2M4CDK7_9DIPT